MTRPLLAIVGPTGTGKTNLAIQLSKLMPSILISADSRQVFQGMDIVTGKDHPKKMTLYGVDIVSPNEPCSVSVWYDAVMPQLDQAWYLGQLPIVVGGTGLYVHALTHSIASIRIPINPRLRKLLEQFTVGDLQLQLHSLNPSRLAIMNYSDANNPRRLIRAIEIASYSSSTVSTPNSQLPTTYIIGLRYSNKLTYQNLVEQRVVVRLKSGALAETKRLLTASPQALSAIGYRSLVAYLNHKISRTTLIDQWVKDELNYAKRQLTWFNKVPNLIWYDPTTLNFTQLESSVKAWYDRAVN